MPLPLNITPGQIALRFALAAIASAAIGFNRDEKGHPAGMRTTMLVCLAATLAMLQVNLLLPTTGKTPSSFPVLDLERLPLGILSGIGFIGAGVIIKREHATVTGVTTAATIWYVTVLGLLFGGGQLILASVGTATALIILWGFKYLERNFKRQEQATLKLTFSKPPDERTLRAHLRKAGCCIKRWCPTYMPPGQMVALECELTWYERAARDPHTPSRLLDFGNLPVNSVSWEQ